MTKHKSQSKAVFTMKDTMLGSMVGGPLAATYLFYKNFKGINQKKYANNTLIIGILSPFVLGGIGIILVNRGVSVLFLTVIYALVVFLLCQRYQTAVIRANKRQGGRYYSNTKATMATLVFFLLYLFLTLGANYLVLKHQDPSQTPMNALSRMLGITKSFDAKKYNELLVKGQNNDKAALSKMALLSENLTAKKVTTLEEALSELDEVKALYTENQKLAAKMSSMDGLTNKLIAQNNYLIKYTELRLEALELNRRAFIENSDKYLDQIKAIVNEINELVANNSKM